MEEYEDLFEKFSKLGLDDKRNAYSNEVIKIALLIRKYLNQMNLDLIKMPYNYQSNEDKSKSEEELLNINYKDIYILKTELLLLLENANKGV